MADIYHNRGLCEGSPYQSFMRTTGGTPSHIRCSHWTFSDHTNASELGHWHARWRVEQALQNHLPNLVYYLENDAQQNAVDHYINNRDGGVILFDNGLKDIDYRQFNNYQLSLIDPRQTLPAPKLDEKTKFRIQRAIRNYKAIFPWNDPTPNFAAEYMRDYRERTPEDLYKFYAQQCRRGVRFVHFGMTATEDSIVGKKYPELVTCLSGKGTPPETWAAWSALNRSSIRHRPPPGPEGTLKTLKPDNEDKKYLIDQAQRLKNALKNVGATFDQIYGDNRGVDPWWVATANLLNHDPLGGAYQEYDNGGEAKGYFVNAFPFKLRELYYIDKQGKIEPYGALKEWLDRFAPESTASVFEKAAAARELSKLGRDRKDSARQRDGAKGVPGGLLASLRGLGEMSMAPSSRMALLVAGVAVVGFGAYFLSRRGE